ncbi:hypothetical protein [Nonomuraea sp. GTA35]|uniref:hypothetical protein n=1 Tax=Nonomuraea sp. GTA35 TaxID=1676746 RepID=UPI0035C20969
MSVQHPQPGQQFPGGVAVGLPGRRGSWCQALVSARANSPPCLRGLPPLES